MDYIKLKEKLDKNDYEEINNLKRLCCEVDKTTLKLELDYKLNRSQRKSSNANYINEFMYYYGDKLIGYIGIGDFGGNKIEVNGMVHPEHRRKGIFKRLFSLVKDEWFKRESQKMLLLSDHNSVSGLEFINYTGAKYAHSEYEMFLRKDIKIDHCFGDITFRKATNYDAKEIARQNTIYFGVECKEEDIVPEEEEKNGMTMYMVEINNNVIGKVNIEINNGIGGIYGLGILPEYRGKGYGRKALKWATEKLKEKNTKEIMLQVEVTNEGALSLYKSCGFQTTSTMEYYQICK